MRWIASWWIAPTRTRGRRAVLHRHSPDEELYTPHVPHRRGMHAMCVVGHCKLPKRKSVVSGTARAAAERTQEKQHKQQVKDGSTLGWSRAFPVALRARDLATGQGTARPRRNTPGGVYVANKGEPISPGVCFGLKSNHPVENLASRNLSNLISRRAIRAQCFMPQLAHPVVSVTRNCHDAVDLLRVRWFPGELRVAQTPLLWFDQNGLSRLIPQRHRDA